MRIDKSPHIMNDLLALCHVPRWVIVPHIGSQSVAEHSFRVTIILLELCRRLDVSLDFNDIMWALVHDGPEAWTGDIPGPFKTDGCDANVAPWWHSTEKLMPDKTKSLIKIADLIEGSSWIGQWGVGQHAVYAGKKLRNEALYKARELAPSIGFGQDQMDKVILAVLTDIECETGRIA